MRTTIDIDEDVLLAARELSRQRRISIGKALSELARQGVSRTYGGRARNGVPLFSVSPSGSIVTPELVKQLLDENP
jgi:hypothetical protein